MPAAATEPDSLIGRRASPRAPCEVAVEIRERGGGWQRAMLHDISRTGFRLARQASRSECNSLWLRLPGLAPLAAKVCWRKGAVVGCQFLYPLPERLQAEVWQVLGLGSTRRPTEHRLGAAYAAVQIAAPRMPPPEALERG